jgi:hypothetical protein
LGAIAIGPLRDGAAGARAAGGIWGTADCITALRDRPEATAPERDGAAGAGTPRDGSAATALERDGAAGTGTPRDGSDAAGPGRGGSVAAVVRGATDDDGIARGGIVIVRTRDGTSALRTAGTIGEISTEVAPISRRAR